MRFKDINLRIMQIVSLSLELSLIVVGFFFITVENLACFKEKPIMVAPLPAAVPRADGHDVDRVQYLRIFRVVDVVFLYLGPAPASLPC